MWNDLKIRYARKSHRDNVIFGLNLQCSAWASCLNEWFDGDVVPRLCWTVYLDNANMLPEYKLNAPLLASYCAGSTSASVFTARLYPNHSDAELWHFTCTSRFGYVIQLSGISKGHNLYLFIWCFWCQCFCVQHEFSQDRCQRYGPC